MIRVLVVDDHAALRDGLRELLTGYDDIDVVGAAADGDEAGRMAAVARPDVVLMDLRMPRADGVVGVANVLREAPTARVLVLTALSDVEHIIHALEAGAIGYLLKDAKPGEIVAAVRSASNGSWDADATIDDLRRRQGEQLSDRDRELLRLAASGRIPGDGSAGRELAELYRRLGVADAESAALWARRHGFV